MRVLITGTGRCGTTTCFHAASCISNYTVGQESIFGTSRSALLRFSGGHIEISPPLHIAVAALKARYQDLCLVHLVREREACARSVARLRNGDGGHVIDVWARSYCGWNDEQRLDVARYYVDCVNATIAANHPDVTIHLERPLAPWERLWRMIGARGNLPESLDQWNHHRNTAEERGEA